MCRCSDEGLAEAMPLDISLSSSGAQCAVEVQPAEGGRLRCRYTALAAGFCRLEVTCRGTHVTGSPFSVQVRLLAVPNHMCCLSRYW